MTNYEMLKTASKLEMANMRCQLVGAADDGCDSCPANKMCYAGHTGMNDWLDKEADEEEWESC